MYWHIAMIIIGLLGFFTSESMFGKSTALLIFMVSGVLVYSDIYLPTYTEQEVSNAKMIANCKLKEENVPHGLFVQNTNKLDCNGVIKNIPVSDYDKAIEMSKNQ